VNENSVIEGCLRGDPEACRRLVEDFAGLVMAAALNVLGNREDAEDVCQETFIKVFSRLESYDPERPFRTWLLTIAYRRSLDMIRKKRRFRQFASRAGFELAEMPSARTANPGRPGPLPSRLLEMLSPRERTALCLWANEGYTAGDISEVLGCSAGTARVYLFNARRKIKSLLENEHAVLQNS